MKFRVAIKYINNRSLDPNMLLFLENLGPPNRYTGLWYVEDGRNRREKIICFEYEHHYVEFFLRFSSLVIVD